MQVIAREDKYAVGNITFFLPSCIHVEFLIWGE